MIISSNRQLLLSLIFCGVMLPFSGCGDPEGIDGNGGNGASSGITGDGVTLDLDGDADSDLTGDEDLNGDGDGDGYDGPAPDPWPQPDPVDLSENPRGETFDFSLAGEHTRVFSFASGPRIEDLASQESFFSYFGDQFLEIASSLPEEGAGIAVFPGGLGLPAGLVGGRGEVARQAETVQEAKTQLIESYDEIIAALTDDFPDLSTEHLLELALTDVRWRSVTETFSTLAAEYETWVIASLESPKVEESDDPEALTLWADPRSEPNLVFVPSAPELWETTLVFDPTGELVEVVYGEGRLSSADGDWTRLRPPQNITPVAVADMAVGILPRSAIWTPSVMERITSMGMHLLIYPAVLEGWAQDHVESPGIWTPDMITTALWTMVQRHPEVRYALIAPYVGNLFDLSFDGQPAIFTQSHQGAPVERFIGQPLRAGMSNISSWVFSDPGEEDNTLTKAIRRQILSQFGFDLLPGSGTQFEGEQFRSIVARDLRKLSDSYEYDIAAELLAPQGVEWIERIEMFQSPLDPTFQGPIQRVRIDTWDDELLISYIVRLGDDLEMAPGAQTTYLRWEADNNTYGHSGGSARLSTAPFVDTQSVFTGSQETIGYSLHVIPERSIMSFSSRAGGALRILGDGFLGYNDVWVPRLSQGDQRIILTLIVGDNGNDRVYYTTSRVATLLQNTIMSLLTITPAEWNWTFEQGDVRANQWNPTADINASSLVVAWSDFRNGHWEIYGSYQLSGEGISEPRRISIEDKSWRLHDEPEIKLLSDHEALVIWTARNEENPNSHILTRRWNLAEDTLGPIQQLSWSDAQASWAPRVEVKDGDIALSWTELRGDQSFIVTDRLDGRGARAISLPGTIVWESDLSFTADRLVVVWSEHHPDEGFGFRIAHLER